MQKRRIDTLPVHQQVFPSSTDNLFLCHRYLKTVFMQRKATHALLASKRCLIDLQLMLF